MVLKPRRMLSACAALTGLLLMVQAVCCPAQARGLPAQEGIINFGKVSEHLYRGARPEADGLKNLQRLGVKTILDLRMPDKLSHAEMAAAQRAGLLYTNIPLHGMGRPTDGQIQTALALIENSSGAVFVHCEHGCDRTGTIIACYRIRHDHWTTDAAMQEAVKYGMSRFERGMKRYILDFARPAGNALASK